MSDEQSTSGTGTNPAAEVQTPRQNAPVMDVVAPPSEPAVVAAPPPDAASATSDDIAQQLAADATTPPEHNEVPASEATHEAPPADPDKPSDSKPTGTGDAPTNVINNELEKQKKAPAAVKLPKARNPGRTAAIATVFATIALAVLATFAYMSTKN